METNKRQHFISLFILSLLLSCSGEKKDSAQTETVSNKAIVRIETVSAQDVEQISEFTATVEANISNNIAPQNPVRIEKLFAEVGDHVKAGQLLVKMDETNLKQTKIQLDNQELDSYEYYDKHRKDVVSINASKNNREFKEIIQEALERST